MLWIRKLEWLLLVLGTCMLGLYVAARFHGVILQRAEVERFKSHRLSAKEPNAKEHVTGDLPDFQLWSAKRIHAYEQSLGEHLAPPIAVLRIPKIGLEVPILEGTDDLNLNRAVGHIPGTSKPGQRGNIGIAGHRDGFFRGLKDVLLGDMIEIITQSETDVYAIDQIVIVHPNDVEVLSPRRYPSLTLVTCYPFYFIGSAPERYIIQASLTGADARSLSQNAGVR